METRLQNIVEKLRQRDFRITPQRLAIVKILADSTAHPSAEQIHEELRNDYPTISLATVYKTASLLKEIGELSELAMKDGSRFDGRTSHSHPHVICTHCKTIIDFDTESLDSLSREVTLKTGYSVVSYRLDFFGICPKCRRTQ